MAVAVPSLMKAGEPPRRHQLILLTWQLSVSAMALAAARALYARWRHEGPAAGRFYLVLAVTAPAWSLALAVLAGALLERIYSEYLESPPPLSAHVLAFVVAVALMGALA